MNDLKKPAPKNPLDKIAVWESELPHSRTSIRAYMSYLTLAHLGSGGGGTVLLSSLVSSFETPAWHDLKNSSSELVTFL